MRGVPIKLDRERKLKYTINSLVDFEESVGMPVVQVAMNPFLMASFRMIRAFLWVGLKWEEHKLTPERTGALIQQFLDEGGDLKVLSTAIEDALLESGVIRRDDAAEDGAGEAYEGNVQEETA